jgi:type VI secretion system protein ImpB
MARETDSARSSRSAAPRVQIAYDSEVDGRRQRRELPFVLGVIGDFSAMPEPPLPRLRERKFVEVERANLDAILEGARPRLALHVENRLRGDDSKLAVELRFRTLDDFGPEEVALQVPPLRKLVDLRNELSDLLRLIHQRQGAVG